MRDGFWHQGMKFKVTQWLVRTQKEKDDGPDEIVADRHHMWSDSKSKLESTSKINGVRIDNA